MDKIKIFILDNKRVIFLIAIPVVLMFSLAYAMKSDEESTKTETLNLNTRMPDAKVDSLAASKANAYQQQADLIQAEKDKNDPYKTGTSMDFSLLDDPDKKEEVVQSAQMQARMEEQYGLDPSSGNSTQNIPNKSTPVKKRNGSFTDEAALDAYYDNSPPPRQNTKPATLANKEPSQKKEFKFNSIDLGTQNTPTTEPGTDLSINAIVFRQAQALPGSTIVFRTMQDATVKGVFIARNTIINGTVQVNNTGRLSVLISGSKIKGQLNATTFSVFDQDGMEGIRVPGSEIGKRVGGTYKEQMDDLAMEAEAHLGTVGRIGKVLLGGGQGGSEKKTTIPDGYKVFLRVSI